MNKYQLTDDQLDAWNGIRQFAKERIAPLAKQIDSSDEFPRELFNELSFGLSCRPGVIWRQCHEELIAIGSVGIRPIIIAATLGTDKFDFWGLRDPTSPT